MDLSIFFATAKNVFEKRQARADSVHDKYVRLGREHVMRIRFASNNLAANLMPAMEHIETEAVESPALTIHVWDSSDGQDKPPYPSWKSHRGYQWVHLLTDENVRVYPEMHPSRLTALNLQTNEALFWIADVNAFPWYERCRPFRTILHWWGTVQNLHLLHAAAVGTERGGALLVGPGGAGKSTTSLACLGSDLRFVSDDHCLLGFEHDKPYAYSIYNAAKLNMASNIERLPDFEQCIVNKNRLQDEKAMMFLKPFYPEFLIDAIPLNAIFVPVVTGRKDTSVVQTNWQETARALIPSTMSELPGAEIENFYGMFQAIKTLPCYRLELGTDMKQIAGAISKALNLPSALAAR